MLNKNLIFVFLFFSHLVFAQGEANNWYFGHNAGINFNNSGTVSNISNSNIQMKTEEGCSTFSDSDGNLLFYSDGQTIWNASNHIMPKGTELLGHKSSTQSAMIIPKPLSTTEYYIFTVGAYFDTNESGFHYYTIDMNADNGNGDIVSGPFNLSGNLNDDWSEKVAAVQGDECNTYWVVSYDGTNIKSYKVSASGVNTTAVVSYAPNPEKDKRGYLKISPNGKKLAIAHYIYKTQNASTPLQGGDSSVFLYDFDDSTGLATNGVRVFDDQDDRIHPYGLEFSRQSTKLYASAMIEQIVATDKIYNSVYQWDLESTDISSSQILIHKQEGYRGALQLGPNGKIYATVPADYRNGTSYLDVINNPEEMGTSTNYQEDAIFLGSGKATQGLPPFISSIFSPIEISGDDGNGNAMLLNGQSLDLCFGDELTISPEPTSGNVTYEWTLNSTFISPDEILILPSVDKSNIGDYKLEVTSIDLCGRKSFRQGYFTINSVSQPPITPVGITPIICDDDYNGTYEFNFKELYSETILNGQSPSEFEVLFFTSQDDAENNTNPLPTPFNSPNTTIYARIHNINNLDCYNTTSFDVNIFQSALPLEPENITPLVFCDNTSVGSDTDGIVLFNLEDRKDEILNGQYEANFELVYYEDDMYTKPIANYTAFKNATPYNQTIYVRVTNKLVAECYAETSFQIKVFELPNAPSTFIFKNCDEDENSDGLTDFNLNEINDYLNDGNSNFIITYHQLFSDAETNSSQLNPLSFNNSVSSTIHARIETPNGCYRITTIDLQVSTTSSSNIDIQELETCDDDDTIDGLHSFDISSISNDIINQLPPGQNLKAKFFRNSKDAVLELNEIVNQEDYINEKPFNQTIYVRIESDDNGECFGIGPYLELVVHPRPEFELDATATVCTNMPPIKIETYNPNGAYLYTWLDENGKVISKLPSAEISNGGVYTVVATSTDTYICESFPQTITVIESNLATIELEDITITDDSNNNTITINNNLNNLGTGNYEFSLNDEYGIYQKDPVFNRVPPGLHILYVRDKNNCGTASIEIAILGFPEFLTPNGDGYNDVWSIVGLDDNFYKVSIIYIYDRFGKILAKIDPKDQGWNGYYNGLELPSDDYWFSTELTDKDGNSRIRKGHFSLIRRQTQ